MNNRIKSPVPFVLVLAALAAVAAQFALVLLALVLLSPSSALAQTAPTPPPRQPTPYEQVAVFQRDEATKALQNTQMELAVTQNAVQELKARVASLEKELADLKAKVPAAGPSPVNPAPSTPDKKSSP